MHIFQQRVCTVICICIYMYHTNEISHGTSRDEYTAHMIYVTSHEISVYLTTSSFVYVTYKQLAVRGVGCTWS